MHGITAQPGGDANVRKLLSDEGVSIAFPIHSDPEMKLLARDSDGQPARSIYVHGKIDRSRDYLEGVQTNEVQPAVVVANSDGDVTRFWSWKSLFQGEELEKQITNKEAISAEATNGQFDPGLAPVSLTGLGASGKSTEDKTWIVNIRPDIDDLLLAILEDRPVGIVEVKSIAEVRVEHHKSMKKQGLSVGDAPDRQEVSASKRLRHSENLP